MLVQRVATAVLLIAAFLAALFLLPAAGWLAVAALVLALGAWEWGGLAALGGAGRLVFAAAVVAAGLGLAVGADLAGGRAGLLEWLRPVYLAAIVFWVVAVPLWLWRFPWAAPRALILAAGCIVLVPTFLAIVHLRNIHPSTLLGFMMVVWIADIAAFFTGRRFGRRKLAPRVSPGKSWEGVYGALAAGALYAAAWAALAPRHAPAAIRDLPAPVVGMIVLVVVLTALSVVGDLFESALKRQAGLKDSGRLLPGHGGVLDRIDALTPVLPVAALVCMT
jgi:phosphatidate cytidylyltransferase